MCSSKVGRLTGLFKKGSNPSLCNIFKTNVSNVPFLKFRRLQQIIRIYYIKFVAGNTNTDKTWKRLVNRLAFLKSWQVFCLLLSFLLVHKVKENEMIN